MSKDYYNCGYVSFILFNYFPMPFRNRFLKHSNKEKLKSTKEKFADKIMFTKFQVFQLRERKKRKEKKNKQLS
jgi:hypothetical protein